MRLCDLLRNIMDDFIIEIYENKEVVKKWNSKQLNEENKKSFDVLQGFDNPLWEKEIKDMMIYKNTIQIAV